MSSPHATDPDHAPPLPEADRKLLADQIAAVPRQDHPDRQGLEPIDWEARVLAIASKAKPIRDKEAAERTVRQQRIHDIRRDKRVQAVLAALDQRFGRYTDARVTDPDVRQWVLDVRAGARGSLILIGNVGTGKTHQAVAAYRAVVEATGCSGLAVPVPALLDSMRPGRTQIAPVETVESIRLLLLDDLAAERASDWTGEVLYRLIDARYARNLPTIITTNATPANVVERLGDRVASRLSGMGRTVILTGPDRRRGVPAPEHAPR